MAGGAGEHPRNGSLSSRKNSRLVLMYCVVFEGAAGPPRSRLLPRREALVHRVTKGSIYAEARALPAAAVAR